MRLRTKQVAERIMMRGAVRKNQWDGAIDYMPWMRDRESRRTPRLLAQMMGNGGASH